MSEVGFGDKQGSGWAWGSNTSLAQTLFIGGVVLLGSFANSLIFAAFPLQPLQPDWQMRVAGSLLSYGGSALIGVLLVVLAQQGLRTGAKVMAARARLIRRLAGWAAIGYLILIPAQVSAGLRLLGERAQADKQPNILWGKMRARILVTETEAQLRELLGRLPDPPVLPEKLNAPWRKSSRN
jgi:hypothetical protein